MPNKNNEYYYIDLHLPTMTITNWGERNTATHTGNTSDLKTHRVFLAKGQFNKLKNKISG